MKVWLVSISNPFIKIIRIPICPSPTTSQPCCWRPRKAAISRGHSFSNSRSLDFILLMVQKSGLPVEIGSFFPWFTRGFSTSQVVFSPDFWTINGSLAFRIPTKTFKIHRRFPQKLLNNIEQLLKTHSPKAKHASYKPLFWGLCVVYLFHICRWSSIYIPTTWQKKQ